MKSEDDNDINIGSFILDISKLLSIDSKINDKIYFSKNINISLYENSNNLFDGVKLGTNFSLIKSDFEKSEFLQFYENMQTIFLNNFATIQNNLTINRVNSKQSQNENLLSEEEHEKNKSPSKCKQYYI